jgi:hypothetical protein
MLFCPRRLTQYLRAVALRALDDTREALFGVGAAVRLLLFIGIHNAWAADACRVFVNKQDTNCERGRDETWEKETL